MRQIGSALLHLHAQGMAHFDVSLENTLLDEHHNAMLTDFGLALPISDLKHYPDFRPGKGCYIAPEIYNGKSFGLSADVFSLGVTLYMMVLGAQPFQQIGDLRYQWIQAGKIFALCAPPRIISSQLTDLLTRALKQNPLERISLADFMKHAWFQL